MTDFKPFPKIARLSREAIITEKLDGTNAQVFIGEDGEMLFGSRSRWITPEDDNFGFARWATGNREDLLKLGPGQHFGEWWGAGIQRRYGLTEKRFSLFNVSRWSDPDVRQLAAASCRRSGAGHSERGPLRAVSVPLGSTALSRLPAS